MKTEIITLPLPASELSPNARVHWAVKSKVVKAHRQTATDEAQRLAGIKAESYMLHFFFKDKRRRDRDNFTGRCKSYLDGVSDAIGQDDSEWEFNGVRFNHDKDNPRLEIRLVVCD